MSAKKPQLHLVRGTEKKEAVTQAVKKKCKAKNDTSIKDVPGCGGLPPITAPHFDTHITVLHAKIEAQGAIIKGIQEEMEMMLNYYNRLLACAENMAARIEKLEY